MTDVRFLPAGDTALVIEFGDTVERSLSERVLALSERVRRAALPGLVETVPTFRSLALHYDPLVTSAEAIRSALGDLLAHPAGQLAPSRLWRLPACYDARCAPDLQDVAAATGLHPQAIGALHVGVQYHVYMVGFAPGQPYLGDLPGALALPRRTDPRVRVPVGSIAIATTMTTIYPVESPGGWHLIGATPVRLFDPGWEQPALLRPGDAVRFEAIPFAEFEAIRTAVAAGEYRVANESIAP